MVSLRPTSHKNISITPRMHYTVERGSVQSLAQTWHGAMQVNETVHTKGAIIHIISRASTAVGR